MIYPFRIEFQPTSLLDHRNWQSGSVKIKHLGSIYFQGINPIVKQELVDKLKDISKGLGLEKE